MDVEAPAAHTNAAGRRRGPRPHCSVKIVSGANFRANVEIVASGSIGIEGIEALHYYVHDLDRTRRFFVDKLDFVEVGQSGPQLEQEGRQRSAAFRAGEAQIVLHQPVGEGGRAWRYLRKHPEGVGTIVHAPFA